MLNPMPREAGHAAPSSADALDGHDLPRPRSTPVTRPSRAAASRTDPEPTRDTQMPIGVVSAGLFLVSGVALQESFVASRPGYAAVGAMALAAALALPLVARFRKRG